MWLYYVPAKQETHVTILTRCRLKRLVLILGAMALSSSAFAAGLDSRTYTCANLQAVIKARGFVFISEPAFGDFVVADGYSCGGRESRIQLRSVPTLDRPECPINYCESRGQFDR